jgi:hypothetical protein
MKNVDFEPDSNIGEKCYGCKFVTGKICRAYLYPEMQWHFGYCPLAPNVNIVKEVKEKEINPLKASKRKARGK